MNPDNIEVAEQDENLTRKAVLSFLPTFGVFAVVQNLEPSVAVPVVLVSFILSLLVLDAMHSPSFAYQTTLDDFAESRAALRGLRGDDR